ncbi:heme-binding protein [Mesorhizobium sp.]|uniref:GlcG/HbpS family heme-binding protein n=1 Tax=Mesorhizobium sp. TaxID=1871066 RepID=UPI0025BC066E|nr:heme-binding protein [Mesorhizobium sp.]
MNDLNEPSSLAVVDQGGNLVAFARSDNAGFGTTDVAINKAYTAAAFKSATADLYAEAQPGGEIFGISNAGGVRPFVIFGGGVPIMRGRNCVGAVGVSGGPIVADLAISRAMADALYPLAQVPTT